MSAPRAKLAASVLAQLRARALSPTRRSEIARAAARARWGGRDKTPRAGAPVDETDRRQGARNSTWKQKRLRRLHAVTELLRGGEK